MAKKQKAPKVAQKTKDVAPETPEIASESTETAQNEVKDTTPAEKAPEATATEAGVIEEVVPTAEALAPVAGKEELLTETSAPNPVIPVLEEMKSEELLKGQEIKKAAPKQEGVRDPALLKKVTGYKDTLAGTVYYGELR